MDGWLTELRQLKERIGSGQPEPVEKPERLSLADILECPDVFQHRSGNQAASEAHVRELAKALRVHPGRLLDPLTVFWIGDGWCCIDGHHRLAAYRDEAIKHSIPVTTYSGTVEKAMTFALQCNSRDKLPMGREEKSNAAWRIVIATHELSKLQISRSAGVSERSVAYMRKTKRQISEAHPEIALDTLMWRDADRIAKGMDPRKEIGSDEWIEVEAQKIVTALCKHFGDRLRKQPHVTARALEMYDQQLVRHLSEWWGGPPDDDDDRSLNPDF